MADNVKPCPFCGSAKVGPIRDEIGWRIVCKSCVASSGRAASKDKAIELWNRRTERGNDGQRNPTHQASPLGQRQGVHDRQHGCPGVFRTHRAIPLPPALGSS
jgi:Lar family restriction alleviation protein